MFTGIIDHCGVILSVKTQAQALQAVIESQFTDVSAGESIAIDGICLTAVRPQQGRFTVDISPETLQRTTAQAFAAGRIVNLERALRLGDRLGGHWVTGHVDGVAKVIDKQPQQDFTAITIGGLGSAGLKYVLKKGSIAVNGASLTVNAVLPDGFQIMLVPHTLERTNLKNLTPGDHVNIEFDWMTRVVINQLKEVQQLL